MAATFKAATIAAHAHALNLVLLSPLRFSSFDVEPT